MDASSSEPTIKPGRKLAGRVAGVFHAPFGDFQTAAINQLDLTFAGIEGDFHGGFTRKSGGREPWYPRGTEMRNERQLTIVAADELAIAAQRMGLAEIRPEWIGANLVLADIPRLSMLPPSTLLFFQGGVTLKVDCQNHPCTLAGRSIAENCFLDNPKEAALLFPKYAQRLRGITAWVEKPGSPRSRLVQTLARRLEQKNPCRRSNAGFLPSPGAMPSAASRLTARTGISPPSWPAFATSTQPRPAKRKRCCPRI